MKRWLLSALLVASTAWLAPAAPAPLPKPRRGSDVHVVEALKHELKKLGILVREITQDGPDGWLVTYLDFQRGGCCRDLTRRQKRMAVPDRSAALVLLLEDCRKWEEERLRQLQRLGVIP